VLSKEKWLPKRASGLEPSDIYDHLTDRWGVVAESDVEHWIIGPTNLLDQQDAGLICATHNNALAGPRDISVGAIINEGLKPFVEMTLGTETIQMTIPQARVQLRVLQEQTEAAVSEAILLHFIDLNLGYDYAVQALKLFRTFREEFEAQ
jgi:hypothetical protein